MAKKTGGKLRSNNHGNSKKKPRGPSSDSQSLRTRPIDEVLGVEALDFGLENEILTPKSGLKHLQLRSEVRHSFNEWMQEIHKSASVVRNPQTRANVDIGMVSVPILQQFNESSVHDSLDNDESSDHDSYANESKDLNVQTDSPVQIELDDIQEEVEFWNSSVICYIIGANPPAHVMDGFVRRIWRKFNVDKVIMVKKGIYLVRFLTMDMRDKVLLGHHFFDSKPVIVKPWSVEMDIEKEEVKSVPIWVQMQLNFKYWGEKSLFKIVHQFGKPIKRDAATVNRDKLQFARVLVDMPLTQDLPSHTDFMDEHGVLTKVALTFEWNPTTCGKCKKMGHRTDECRSGSKRVWVQKQVVVPSVEAPIEVDQEGFQRALRPIRVRSNDPKPTQLNNTFQLLNTEQGGDDANEQNVVVVGGSGEKIGGSVGRGNPPSSYG